MTRTEVIKELSGHVDHSILRVIQWDSTAALKAYLAYQREPDKEPRKAQEAGAKHVPVKCGCGAPWAHTGKHWPVDTTSSTGSFFGYEIVIDHAAPPGSWRLEPREKKNILRTIVHRMRGRQ